MNPQGRSHTVLVTGASGFIGRRMLAVLRSHGAQTIGLDRNDPRLDSKSTNRPRGTWIVADISVETPIVLPAGIDTVVHLAGKAHSLVDVAQDVEEYFNVNTEGTRRILEASQRVGVRAFVFFSTVKAAGNRRNADDAGPVDETWEAEPDTPYGRSKSKAERLVLEGGYVPHPVVLRPCLVYGPMPKGNLADMIEAVSCGRFPPLPEFGNRRSMVHIDDVISAAILVAEKPKAAGCTYIVADNEPFSTRQLFEWLCLAGGGSVPRWVLPLWVLRVLARVGDGISYMRRRRFRFDSETLEKLTSSAWYSSGKLQRELGWRPNHTLRESLPEICASAKKNGGKMAH